MPFKKVRVSLVLIAGIFTLATFPPVFSWEWKQYNQFFGVEKIDAFPWHDATKEAVTNLMSLSKDLFQSGLLLIAAMWGVLLVKKEEAAVVFDAWPEKALLILATVSVISSCVSHIAFVQTMTSYAMDASITDKLPNLTHREVSYGLVAQCVSLVGGALIAGSTVMSASWFNKKDNQ
ncbi:MAG: hypothetical protein SGI77_16185 [Pirellulaceae bacterium]|nr:hypothetical protein [Pirellulaceae bacterium]